MSPVLELQLIAAVTALACALPGCALLLRRQTLLSDAISHSVLLGIVLAFLVLGRLDSPWLLVAAASSGMGMVWLVDLLRRSGRMREDAAIGLVFPLLFSIAVILITRLADNVHLDTDAVLLGELAFAPFRRLELLGLDLPVALWQMSGMLVVNLVFLLVFWKELALASFDPLLAATLGFLPGALHMVELSLLSLTCVGAFDTVGSVLVVALIVAPPATARLLSDRLPTMYLLAGAIAVINALAGWQLASLLDASIAGSMSVAGVGMFVLALVFSPRQGVLVVWLRAGRQRRLFSRRMLCIHLFHHEGTPGEERECRLGHLSEHLDWSPAAAERVVDWAVAEGEVERGLPRAAGRLHLLDKGRQLARRALEELPLQLVRRGLALDADGLVDRFP